MTYPTDRTAVVTGAGSPLGIGAAVARRLARAGWNVGLIDVALPSTSPDGLVVGHTADVTDPAQIDAAASFFERELPPVLALVNVAGISDPTRFLDTGLDRWQRVIGVNLTGTFLVMKRFVPGMVDRGVGRVVNLSSTAAQTGGGTYSATAYAASKAGIEGLTHGAALELAPTGVTVNVVSPAVIDTEIMGGRITDERKPAFVAGLPVGRLGTTDEVAALIEFLIGPDAGYITGAHYNINGGARIG
ncbi:SDR family oxidoreductase [Actinoplanes sp. NPDC051411]|uniref:SDR family NAD(P)-dependent oxidoreductase n=1 Tax=Actinoplanes sp. NPDC051411 TaxID=3155522 RepID=UPI003430F97E